MLLVQSIGNYSILARPLLPLLDTLMQAMLLALMIVDHLLEIFSNLMIVQLPGHHRSKGLLQYLQQKLNIWPSQ